MEYIQKLSCYMVLILFIISFIEYYNYNFKWIENSIVENTNHRIRYNPYIQKPIQSTNTADTSSIYSINNNLVKASSQIARASRYERNAKTSKIMNLIKDKLLEVVLEAPRKTDGKSSKSKGFNNTLFIIHLKGPTKVEDIIKNYKILKHSKLFIFSNFNYSKIDRKIFNNILREHMSDIIEIHHFKSKETFPKYLLADIMENIKFKYIIVLPVVTLLERSIIMENINLKMKKLILPLARNESDVTSLPPVDLKMNWDLGCYQLKTLWYQHRIIKGYDVIDKDGSVYCDYVTGMFALSGKLFQYYLKHSLDNYISGSVTSPSQSGTDRMFKKPDEFLQSEIFYLDLFKFLTDEGKIVKVLSAVSSKALLTNELNRSFSKKEILPFVVKNGLNTIVFPNGTKIDFTCEESNAFTSGLNMQKTGLFLPKCLMKELHDLLVQSSKLFTRHRFEYELDAGSILGSAKLTGTLPWERDHDLVFRSRNFSALMKIEEKFMKIGYKLSPNFKEIKKCLKSGYWSCGYVGIHGYKHWRMELWGQNVLVGDFYKQNNTKQLARSNVIGNSTLGQVGKYFLPTIPNPGLFSRSRYGLDVLKHAKHWYDTGEESSHVAYKAGRWQKCKLPGNHACSNNYLADGNLQFKWLSDGL